MLTVPADTPSDVTVLTDANRGGDGKTHQWVWIQLWGRHPGDADAMREPTGKGAERQD